MAPEIIEGLGYSFSCDIYSIGNIKFKSIIYKVFVFMNLYVVFSHMGKNW